MFKWMNYARYGKSLAVIWAVLSIIVGVCALTLFEQSKVETDILALLPEDADSALVSQANGSFVKSVESKVVYALSAKKESVLRFYDELENSGLFIHLNGKLNEKNLSETYDFLCRHRVAFVDTATAGRLRDADSQSRWALAQIYNPFAGVSSVELKSDPLLLLRSSKTSLTQERHVVVKDGWLSAKDREGKEYFVIEGTLKPGLNLEETAQALERIESAFSESKIYKQGVVFYTAYATKVAKNDITVLGSFSVLGLFIIFWLSFRSFRPFLLCALSLSVGVVFALVLTLLVFGSIHSVTLVMCVSLVGVSADYTIYFLVDRMDTGKTDCPLQTRDRLSGSLIHAVLTSSAAYAFMLFAPLPGLRQFALFSAVGLLASCTTVLLWFPYLVKGFPVRPIPCNRLFSSWVDLWTNRSKCLIGLFCFLVLILAMGLPRVHVNDDIRSLQNASEKLTQDERKISELLGLDMTQHWFIVVGKNEDEALNKLKELEAKLHELKIRGTIRGFDSFPILSKERQSELMQYYEMVEKEHFRRLSQMGIPVKESVPTEVLSLSELLKQPFMRSLASRVVTLDGDRRALIVTVSGNQEKTLEQLANNDDGVFWYSRKTSLDRVFVQYREIVTKLLLFAYAFVFFSFSKTFGLRMGTVATVSSAVSILMAMATLGLWGIEFNLFSLFALVLVLGIGIDYVVFFQRHRENACRVGFSVTIAMATTVMSLGVLCLSKTPAVSNFGLVLFSGIVCAFILAPLVLMVKK